MTPEQRQKRRAERERLAQEQREADLKAVLETPAGRRLVWDLLDRRCGVFSGSFSVDSERGTRITDFNEGGRAVGIQLMQDAQAAAPHSYETLVLEQIKWANEQALALKAEAVPKSTQGSGS